MLVYRVNESVFCEDRECVILVGAATNHFARRRPKLATTTMALAKQGVSSRVSSSFRVVFELIVSICFVVCVLRVDSLKRHDH